VNIKTKKLPKLERSQFLCIAQDPTSRLLGL